MGLPCIFAEDTATGPVGAANTRRCDWQVVGETVDPPVEYGYEEHQARSEDSGMGRPIRCALEGVHCVTFEMLLLSTGGHSAGKKRGFGEIEFTGRT